MEYLNSLTATSSFLGSKHNNFVVALCDNFQYIDPIDKTVSKNQGFRIIFTEGSRIICRLSGTGSQGATIRLYFEKFELETFQQDTKDAIHDLIEVALNITRLAEFTGISEPTVIT
jgi:phosphoglucomutase